MPIDKRILEADFHRDFVAAEVRGSEEDDRVIDMSISSETPVERWFGNEILVHDRGAVDTEFMGSGTAPLLMDHDHREQIGVVQSVELDEATRKLRARVRFSKRQYAQEILDDVKDGIRSNVSIGYRILEWVERADDDEVRITSWKPFEVSIVSVPADDKVGVGRAAQPATTQSTQEGAMPDTPIERQEATNESTLIVNTPNGEREVRWTQSQVDDRVNERLATRDRENAEIVGLGAIHQMQDAAREYIRDGRSLAEFTGYVRENISADTPIRNEDIGLTASETRDFSVMRLTRALTRGASRADMDAARFELEACEEASNMSENRANNGFSMPAEVMRNFVTSEMMRELGHVPMQRTLLAGTDTAMIPTDHLASSFIELLRSSVVTMRAGARTLTGLSGNVDIPRMATSAGATWISAEHGDSTDGEPTFDTVSMTPHDLSVSVPISRRMRQQSSPAIEGLVRMDIVQAMALALDLAALEGSGSSGQPEGILNVTGVNKPTAFAAADPTWAEVVAMETAVADDNALQGSMAYISRTNMRGALKTTKKDAGSGLFVAEGNMLNGYDYLTTNQITDGNMYFGNFSELLMGMWGGLDLVFDDATLAAKNGLYIRAFQTVDLAVRHPVSFCYNNDT